MMRIGSMLPIGILLVVLILCGNLYTVVAQAEQLDTRAVISPRHRTILSGEIAGKVISLPKRPGDSFQKGDLLVKLDCRVYEAQADKVAAENGAARVKVKNAEQLNELRSIGSLDVSLARYEYQQTTAMLKIAKLNTSRCSIKAPYEDKVVTVYINEYETITPQQELIEIVSDKLLEAEIVAPARWLRWLTEGTPFELTVDETGSNHAATVTSLSPVIDPVSQTLNVRAKVDNSDTLTPGMSATAHFQRPTPE